MKVMYYELTYDIRIPVGMVYPQPAKIMRQVCTVADPSRQSHTCFSRAFEDFCLYTRLRDGVWYVIPSRSWLDCPSVFGAVRLVGFRRIKPGTLDHALTNVFKKACA